MSIIYADPYDSIPVTRWIDPYGREPGTFEEWISAKYNSEPIPPHQKEPSVAFDGTNYLVVWTDWRNGYYADIYGARVSPAGIVLDPQGFSISTAEDAQVFPSVAFDGTNYLVVWEDWRNGAYPHIYGARVSPQGIVLDTNGIPISINASWHVEPSITFDGVNYLVVWADSRASSYDIYGARVSPAGIVLDTKGIPISTAAYSQGCPSVASDGTNYLVVWEDYRSGDYPDIYGARVSPAGVVLDTAGIPISTAPMWQLTPSIAFDGTNYFVVWRDTGIYGARISPAGVVLDTNGILISHGPYGQTDPSIAFGGTNYLVAWKDERHGGYDLDIYCARVLPEGIVLDTNGIFIATARQWGPDYFYLSVAFGGTNYLVVWEDYWNYTCYRIYCARVSRNGEVLDPNGFPIGVIEEDRYSPAALRPPPKIYPNPVRTAVRIF
ncbi:MAG: hypothetical protein ABIK94_04825, partial [candidate division WOR-3 bacterium]